MRFSLIIPVYNVEQYLRECLDSVLSQDFSDWEAICVDDGSTDQSSAILDSYAKRENRFVVVHKKNEGVSVARNVGLSMARGDWVVFIDSDDIVARDYLSRLDESISQCQQVEILMHKPSLIDFDGSKHRMITQANESFMFSGDVLGGICNHAAQYQILSCVWDKAFKKSLLVNHNISFLPGLQIGEDSLFDEIAFSRAKCFKFDASINSYLYRRREGSLYTKISDEANYARLKRACAEIENYYVIKAQSSLCVAIHGAASMFYLPSSFDSANKWKFITRLAKDADFTQIVLPFLIKHGHIKARIFSVLLSSLPAQIKALLVYAINTILKR